MRHAGFPAGEPRPKARQEGDDYPIRPAAATLAAALAAAALVSTLAAATLAAALAAATLANRPTPLPLWRR